MREKKAKSNKYKGDKHKTQSVGKCFLKKSEVSPPIVIKFLKTHSTLQSPSQECLPWISRGRRSEDLTFTILTWNLHAKAVGLPVSHSQVSGMGSTQLSFNSSPQFSDKGEDLDR